MRTRTNPTCGSRSKELIGTLRKYELESKLLEKGYIRDSIGEYYSVIKGDTRSLESGSYGVGILWGSLTCAQKSPALGMRQRSDRHSGGCIFLAVRQSFLKQGLTWRYYEL